MTSFYSWRQFLMTFFGPYRGAQAESSAHGHGADGHGHAIKLSDVHEAPLTMLLPLAVLAVGAVFAGA
jgi:NADH-quinone oxidoreductase subunit L